MCVCLYITFILFVPLFRSLRKVYYKQNRALQAFKKENKEIHKLHTLKYSIYKLQLVAIKYKIILFVIQFFLDYHVFTQDIIS